MVGRYRPGWRNGPAVRLRFASACVLAAKQGWPAGQVGKDWLIASMAVHVYSFKNTHDQRPIVFGVDYSSQELLVACASRT